MKPNTQQPVDTTEDQNISNPSNTKRVDSTDNEVAKVKTIAKPDNCLLHACDCMKTVKK